jgi:hypothetical protein
MALAAIKIWVPGEVLYASDLNAMNTNILNNGLALISPLTGNVDAGGYALTNTGSIIFRDAATVPSTLGQLQRNGTALQYYDGTTAHTLLTATAASTFNYVFNSSFEVWGSGTAAAPTGWTQNGGTVSRSSTSKLESYALSLQRVGSDCEVYQNIAATYHPVSRWIGKVVTFGCWVSASIASRARVSIEDGIGTTSSTDHSGSGNYEWLTVTRTIAVGATYLRARCQVITGDTTALFDGATLVVASSVADAIPSGWQGRKAIFPLGTGATTVPAGSTFYAGVSIVASAESLTYSRVPFNGVARNLHIRAGNNPGVGQTYTYTIRKSGVDTALAGTISEPSQLLDQVTSEVAFIRGQYINMKIVTSAGAGVYVHNGSLEYEEIP